MRNRKRKSEDSSQIELLLELETSASLLQNIIESVPKTLFKKRTIEFVGRDDGLVSPCDIIAYQIGWGQAFLAWYRDGLKGLDPEMPLKGYGWDYEAIANHFYSEYGSKSRSALIDLFSKTVSEIGRVIVDEANTGQLDAVEVWEWCRLKNGKWWPLSKWIKVNTISPYKRATKLLKNFLKN